MANTFSVKLLIHEPNLPVNFSISIDDEEKFSVTTTEKEYYFETEIPDDIGKVHSVKFTLSGKTDDHTTFDENDNILSSAQVELKEISFNDMDITEVLIANDPMMTYTHNSNGYTEEIVENFYTEVMGYNGTIEIQYKTPLYAWLLDVM